MTKTDETGSAPCDEYLFERLKSESLSDVNVTESMTLFPMVSHRLISSALNHSAEDVELKISNTRPSVCILVKHRFSLKENKLDGVNLKCNGLH